LHKTIKTFLIFKQFKTTSPSDFRDRFVA